MQINGQSALEVPPFSELVERPGYFSYCSIDNLSESSRLPDHTEFVGAIGVALAIREGEPALEICSELTPSFLEHPEPAASLLVDSQEAVVASAAPTLGDEVLEAFRTTALDRSLDRLHQYGHRLLGGLAIHQEDNGGYRAGLFMAKTITQEFTSTAHNLVLHRNQLRGQPSPVLKAVTERFPSDIWANKNKPLFAAIVGQTVRASIAANLPDTASLRRELHIDIATPDFTPVETPAETPAVATEVILAA